MSESGGTPSPFSLLQAHSSPGGKAAGSRLAHVDDLVDRAGMLFLSRSVAVWRMSGAFADPTELHAVSFETDLVCSLTVQVSP